MAFLRSGLTGTQLVQLALNESVAYGCSYALSGKREERKEKRQAEGGASGRTRAGGEGRSNGACVAGSVSVLGAGSSRSQG